MQDQVRMFSASNTEANITLTRTITNQHGMLTAPGQEGSTAED